METVQAWLFICANAFPVWAVFGCVLFLVPSQEMGLQSRIRKKRMMNSIDTKEKGVKPHTGLSSQANVRTVLKEKGNGNRAVPPLWS